MCPVILLFSLLTCYRIAVEGGLGEDWRIGALSWLMLLLPSSMWSNVPGHVALLLDALLLLGG